MVLIMFGSQEEKREGNRPQFLDDIFQRRRIHEASSS